jgi:CheY-like chemotaxis protein
MKEIISKENIQKILIVDDAVFNLKSLKKALKTFITANNLKYTILTAYDAAEALELVKIDSVTEKKIAILITEVNKSIK